MSEIMVEITQVVLIVVMVIAIKYLVPWLKAQVEASQYAWVVQIVADAVQYAEQTLTDAGCGQKKFDMVIRYVKNCLAEKNISVSDEQLKALIESAVYLLNQEAANGD